MILAFAARTASLVAGRSSVVGAFWVSPKVGIKGRLGDIEASCSGCIFIGPRDFDLLQGMNDNSRVGLLFGGTAQEKGWNLSSAATRSKEEIKSAAHEL